MHMKQRVYILISSKRVGLRNFIVLYDNVYKNIKISQSRKVSELCRDYGICQPAVLTGKKNRNQMMAIKNGLIPDRQHNLKFFLAQTARYLHFWLCYIWLIHHPPPINKGTLIAKPVCPFHLLDICLSNFVNLRTTVWHNIFYLCYN